MLPWRNWQHRPVDAVDRQLREIARQGRGMAAVAHICSGALLILFSLASLIALGGDTVSVLLRDWQAGAVDIPAAISLSVITLMVLAFDVGMLYAASMLRLLGTRRSELGERWVHVAILTGVAAIEASTYVLMAYRYERPADWLAWALIIGRAGAAPLLSIYLSLARALPVTARDILAQVELASGAGLIRDAVTLANDGGVPLARKAALYGASAVMLPAERTRLDNLLEVMGDAPASAPQLTPPSPDSGPDDTPPEPRYRYDADSGVHKPLHLMRRALTPTERQVARTRAKSVGRRQSAFDALDAHPSLTRTDLASILGCRPATAGGYMREWQAQRNEHQQRRVAL